MHLLTETMLSASLEVVLYPLVMRRWTENDIAFICEDVGEEIQARSASAREYQLIRVQAELDGGI